MTTNASATRTTKGLEITDPAGRTFTANGKLALSAEAVTFSEYSDGTWANALNRNAANAGKAVRYGTGRTIVVLVED